MHKLPAIRPKVLVRLLKRKGFYEHRQKGSHLIMLHVTLNRQAVIPMHNTTLPKGTLASILREAGLHFTDLI